jgi:transcription initiation factor TFIIA large subunit
MSTPPVNQNQGGGLTMPQMNNNVNQNAPRIKTEPGVGSPHLNNGQSQQPYQPQAPLLPPNATTAQQRAAQNLQQNYGPRAAASISAIHSGVRQQGQDGQQQSSMQQMHLPQMQQPPMNQEQYRAYVQMQQNQQNGARPMQQGQGQQPQRPPLTEDQYKHLMAQQAARQMQHTAAANGRNGVGNAQTDGTGDEVEGLTVIKQFGPNGEEMSMGRVEIDGLIRSRIEAMGQRMEGGGLMLPLQQASSAKSRKRKVKSSKAAGKMVQVDGGDDDDDDIKDEELDEDAINSDLDDPDENPNDDEDDDESMGNIMLCMYDKVQRVKNKW